MDKQSKPIVFYPIIFGGLPVLILFSSNLNNITFAQTYRAFSLALGVTLFLFLIFRLIFKSWERAGLVLTIFVIYFFYFGTLLRFLVYSLYKIPFFLPMIVILMIYLIILPIFWASRTLRNPGTFTLPLNVVTAVLLFYNLVLIGNFQVQSVIRKPSVHVSGLSITRKRGDNPMEQVRRNIYYIILDSYSRADVLQSQFNFDNGPFLASLEKKGFFIAQDSYSNYHQTLSSLGSSLNMSYLDDLLELHPESNNRRLLNEPIRNNLVRTFLKNEGYHFVTTATGYEGTTISDADTFLDSPTKINMFERGIIENSLAIFTKSVYLLPYHRLQIIGQFDQLEQLVDLPGPKFVFGHFLIPHPPFLIDRNGNLRDHVRRIDFNDGGYYKETKEEYRDGYTEQVLYVNQRLEKIIDKILQQPGPEPIIIIQADHGSGLHLDYSSLENTCASERFSILNAYYLPDDGDQILYPQISPVNTFRVVLNHYFGTSFSLLEDKSYFSEYEKPYQFYEVKREQLNTPCFPQGQR